MKEHESLAMNTSPNPIVNMASGIFKSQVPDQVPVQGQAPRNFAKDVEEATLKTLREICENCNYYSLNTVDKKQMAVFIRTLRQLITDYWEIELQDDFDTSFEYRESELDTDSSEEGEKFDMVSHEQKFDLDPHNANNSDSESDEDYSDTDSNISRSQVGEGHELNDMLKKNKKDKDVVIEKLARMLIVFTKLLQSNYIYRDLFQLADFTNRDLARSLLKLLKADNILITYLSSKCLKAIMQFSNSSEIHAERRNKEAMISMS